jgi:hypothetical protein
MSAVLNKQFGDGVTGQMGDRGTHGEQLQQSIRNMAVEQGRLIQGELADRIAQWEQRTYPVQQQQQGVCPIKKRQQEQQMCDL